MSEGPAVTAAALVARACRQFSSRIAVIDGELEITYGALEERSLALARAFVARGLKRGDRIGLVAANRREFLEVEHACLRSGLVRVAEVPRLHPAEVAEILADCSARVVVVEESWLPRLLELADALPELQRIVVLGARTPQAESYEELIAEGLASDVELPVVRGEDLAWLLYSSGTTGRPKGVMLTHAAVASMARNVLVELPTISDEDVTAHAAPLGHLSGVLGLTTLLRGSAQLTLPTFDPTSLLAEIRTRRVSVMIAVPTMIGALVDAATITPGPTDSLRAIVYAASPISPDRLRRAVETFGEVFVQFYGQSEALIPVTALSIADHRPGRDGLPRRRLASAGRPSLGVQLRIVDEDRRDVPTGEVGEIAVRSDMTMRGYWNQPELTAQVLSADGWLLTADVGRLDDEGFLYVVDRKKDMVITGGFNVYPNEVENAIATLDAVAEVVVVGAPHDHWGEQLVAEVVLQPGRSLTVEQVMARCRERLGGYKVPKQVTFVDRLPKNERGKLLRRRVRDVYWAASERSI